jgi:hypothetical protein
MTNLSRFKMPVLQTNEVMYKPAGKLRVSMICWPFLPFSGMRFATLPFTSATTRVASSTS